MNGDIKDNWKELFYKHMEEKLNFYELKEGNINIDYERRKVTIEFTLDMNQLRRYTK